MRNLLALLLTINLLVFSGCSTEEHSAINQPSSAQPKQSDETARLAQGPAPRAQAPAVNGDARADAQVVSLSDATSAQAASVAFDRKIIRNAELTLETESPTDGQRRTTAIAES